MEAYEEYMRLLNSFNFGWLIILIVMVIALMVVVSIIKYNINIRIIKKSVKEAIRELQIEDENKKEKDTNE